MLAATVALGHLFTVNDSSMGCAVKKRPSWAIERSSALEVLLSALRHLPPAHRHRHGGPQRVSDA